MATEIGYAIAQDLQTLIQSAGLVGISADAVRIRELPLAGEQIETTPSVFICPRDSKQEPIGFEGSINVPYRMEVALIDATMGEYGVNQEKRQKWASSVLNKIMFDNSGDYRTSLPNVPSVWNIENEPSSTFDRDKFSNLYSYSTLIFLVHSTA